MTIESNLHEPELLPRPVFDAVAAELRARDLSALLNAGPKVHWFSDTELLQRYVAGGGLLPGVSPLEVEFGLATALRSVRSLLAAYTVHEVNAPGFPWVARLCGTITASFSPRNEDAREVRSLFEATVERAHEPGSAVVAFATDEVVFELDGAPLVWIGGREQGDVVETRLRGMYDDVERYSIIERAPNYGLFPERVHDGLNVIVVGSHGPVKAAATTPRVTSIRARDPFRLLIVARPDRKKYPIGGVETLIQQVTSAMEERGAVVDIQETQTPDARGYDVAHIIGGLAENVIQQGTAVRAVGVPLALTPVFATYEGFLWFVGSSLTAHGDPRVSEQERVIDGMRKRMIIAGGFDPTPKGKDFRDLTMMRRGYALADNLFICAYGEAREIAVRLGVYRPTTFIPNGVDTNVMRPDIPRVPILPKRPYVLMATRIDAQKNLQGLFDAVRPLDIDVVILGRIDVDSYPHAGIIMSNATANAITIPSVPLQTHPWFGSLFSNATAVMVPSWAEVFSLNVLDAAACAVPIIMGHAGFHVELLEDLGYYVDPCDPDAIREAILSAAAEDDETKQRRRDLARRVHAEYAWDHVGDLLYEAYRSMAARGPVPVRGV